MSSLVAGHPAGEPAAEAFERYRAPVYRYCYRQLRDRQQAEDAASQVFYKALASFASYSDTAKVSAPSPESPAFRPWLFAIAHNVTADVLRRPLPERPLSAADDAPDPARTPEEAALATEVRETLQDAMRRLPPDQRRVMALRAAGLTGPEAARALGRSLGSVKMLQLRAVGRLRLLLIASGLVSVFVALVAGALWVGAGRLRPVEADVLLRKAYAAATTGLAGLRSVHARTVYRDGPGAAMPMGGPTQTVREVWWVRPNRWRSETRVFSSDGSVGFSGMVTDGQVAWTYGNQPQYSPGRRDETIRRVKIFPMNLGGGENRMLLPDSVPLPLFDSAVMRDLEQLLDRAASCYAPQVTGRATVAGRATFVVDLGQPRCQPEQPSPLTRQVLWIDPETSFVLKIEHYGKGGALAASKEVTAIEVDGSIAETLLRFDPPAGAEVRDCRTAPGPDCPQLGTSR